MLPVMDPVPPARVVPPNMTEAIASSSYPRPVWTSITLARADAINPPRADKIPMKI